MGKQEVDPETGLESWFEKPRFIRFLKTLKTLKTSKVQILGFWFFLIFVQSYTDHI